MEGKAFAETIVNHSIHDLVDANGGDLLEKPLEIFDQADEVHAIESPQMPAARRCLGRRSAEPAIKEIHEVPKLAGCVPVVPDGRIRLGRERLGVIDDLVDSGGEGDRGTSHV